MERRAFKFNDLRTVDPMDGQGPRILGYAAVFDSLSLDLGGFREMISPGAFAQSLAGDVRALWAHDPSRPLARTINGTLLLSEDERGLGVSIEPPDTTWGSDALASIGRGDVNQMSFGFSLADEEADQEWSVDEERGVIRRLKRITLHEVSPVAFPAYPATTVAMRAFWGDLPQIPSGLRAGTGSGVGMDDSLRARRGRERKIQLATMGAR